MRSVVLTPFGQYTDMITIIVPFSGGKDSQASLIWAVKEFGAKNVKAIFCDTNWEHALTPEHVQDVTSLLGVELVVIKSKKYTGMVDLATQKGRFPSRKAQFCTEKLKIEPQIDWILDELNDDFILIDGRRRSESEGRSKLEETCSYFRYYIEPYGTDRHGKPKRLSYRRKEVLKFIKAKKANEVIRPFVHSSAEDVIQYILDNGQKPNKLYYMGFSRVGCMPCINAKLPEIELMTRVSPEYIDKVREAEDTVSRTFFAPEKIPQRYSSVVVTTDEGKTVRVPNIDDVVKYVKFMNAQTALFEEPQNPSCMNFYNICE